MLASGQGGLSGVSSEIPRRLEAEPALGVGGGRGTDDDVVQQRDVDDLGGFARGAGDADVDLSR